MYRSAFGSSMSNGMNSATRALAGTGYRQRVDLTAEGGHHGDVQVGQAGQGGFDEFGEVAVGEGALGHDHDRAGIVQLRPPGRGSQSAALRPGRMPTRCTESGVSPRSNSKPGTVSTAAASGTVKTPSTNVGRSPWRPRTAGPRRDGPGPAASSWRTGRWRPGSRLLILVGPDGTGPKKVASSLPRASGTALTRPSGGAGDGCAHRGGDGSEPQGVADQVLVGVLLQQALQEGVLLGMGLTNAYVQS